MLGSVSVTCNAVKFSITSSIMLDGEQSQTVMSNCELNSNDGVGLISAKYDVGALAGYVYYGTSITNSTVRNMRINDIKASKRAKLA